MQRCLSTAAPTAEAAGLPLLVHGGMFEFRCAGLDFAGTTAEEIQQSFEASPQPGVPLEFAHFREENGRWLYNGDQEKETAEEAKQRAGRMADWVRRELMPGLGTAHGSAEGGVGILVAHQTFLDLLCQILLDGTDEGFAYGQPQFKLQNAACVELEVELSAAGEATFTLAQHTTRAPAAAKRSDSATDLPGSPMKSMFQQWAKGEEAAPKGDGGVDLGMLFRSWADSAGDNMPETEEQLEERGARGWEALAYRRGLEGFHQEMASRMRPEPLCSAWRVPLTMPLV